MNPKILFTLSLIAVSLFRETCHASSEAESTAPSGAALGDDDDGGGDDDEYYDLANMTDEELEEICTSRGFELVRDSDTVYTHQDYVDAASECLQIEEDLEEILETHPEILEDVKRENERMAIERDRLLGQLTEQEGTEALVNQNDNNTAAVESNTRNEGTGASPALKSFALAAKDMGMTAYEMARRYWIALMNKGEGGRGNVAGDNNTASVKSNTLNEGTGASMNQNDNDTAGAVGSNTLDQGAKAPALKSFALVAKDMGMTAYDMARRYWIEFMNKGEGGRENVADDNNTAAVESNITNSGGKSTASDDDKLTYDMKEITLEVIEQIKADITKVVNLVLPEKLREQLSLQIKEHIQPALKSCALVAKDMGKTAYDIARRYWIAFVNKGEEGRESVASDEKLSKQNNNSSQEEETETEAS